jgi:hypothetical protein
MTAQDATQTLLDQLLHQFKHSENIVKLIGVLGNMFQDTFDAADYIQSAVTLDDYEGEQLEFWGELIGVKRPRRQEDPANIFTLCSRGEGGDLDNRTGFAARADTVTTGGYMTAREGLPDQSDSTTEMTDADYRYLILQKAASYRKKMTHTNLYNYLLAFGARCKLDDSTDMENIIQPQNWNDLSEFFKHYCETRGFKPSGIRVQFEGNIREEEI